MNRTLKTIIYWILGFMVLSLIARLFFNALPYILLMMLIIFSYFKIKGYFIKRKIEKSGYNKKKAYNSYEESEYEASTVEEDDDVVSDIIDVDYKEVE
ncbi:MAG: hypothetical protein RSC24_12960 [Clostridium sp.]